MSLDLFTRTVVAPTRKQTRNIEAGNWGERERLLVDSCHPKQRDFVLDPHRRVCALVGRGGGKTTGILARFTRRMMRTARARCLYVATTRDQAIDLLWNPLKDLIEQLGIEARLNETSLRCTFVQTRSNLKLVGADDRRQIEKYRGLPHHEVWVDESASYPIELLEHLLNRIIGPRLGDYGGMLGMVGTPGHILRGEFYEHTRDGSPTSRPYADREKSEFADWVGWSLHTWNLEDGAPYVPALARLWEEALIEKRAQGWSDRHPVWLREYRGKWAADNTDHVFRYTPHADDGSEWNQWNPARDARGFAILPSDINDPHYVYGMDLGHSDPFALCVFAYSPTDPRKRLFHVFEYEAREMYPRRIAELLLGPELDHERPTGVLAASGWPEAMVADTAALGAGYLEELQQVYGIQIEAADKRTASKFDSIEMFNGDLIDGRIVILKGSRLETQLQELQWETDEYNRVRENKSQRNDQADAAIYARRRAQHLLAEENPTPHRPSPFAPPPERPWEEEPKSEYAELLSSGQFDDGGWQW